MAKYEVTYTLPSLGSKRFKKIVEATYQHEAKAIAEAEMPSAKILGGPRRLNG
jgi:hypothetical protein